MARFEALLPKALKAAGALARSTLWVVVVPAAVASVSALFARAGFPFELAVHFKPWCLVAGSAVAGGGLLLGSRALMALGSGVAALNLLSLLLALEPAPSLAPEETGELTIVFGNIHSDPVAAENLARLALRQNADAVIAAETGDAERAALASVLTGYPCRSLPTPGAWGVSAYGRGDCEAFQPILPPPVVTPGRRYPLGRLALAGIDLRGVHVVPPMSASWERARNAAIEAAAAPMEPGLAIGDFNASPWSPPIQRLQRRGLKRVRCGGPFAFTWPVGARLPGVTIDHAFVTDGLAAKCEVGPDIGSDHYPLVLKLSRRS